MKVFLWYFRNSDRSAIPLMMQSQHLKNLYAVCMEIRRLKKLTNWEWSYSKPDSTKTEKILIWLVYHHMTATCVSILIELVMSQICFMNQESWIMFHVARWSSRTWMGFKTEKSNGEKNVFHTILATYLIPMTKWIVTM